MGELIVSGAVIILLIGLVFQQINYRLKRVEDRLDRLLIKNGIEPINKPKDKGGNNE